MQYFGSNNFHNAKSCCFSAADYVLVKMLRFHIHLVLYLNKLEWLNTSNRYVTFHVVENMIIMRIVTILFLDVSVAVEVAF